MKFEMGITVMLTYMLQHANVVKEKYERNVYFGVCIGDTGTGGEGWVGVCWKF